METKQYTTIDKSEWPRGPWDHEPDKIQWQDEATGLPCLIVRACLTGSLCGYAGVPDSHPWHGKGYADEPVSDLAVHGGLTFANECGHGGEEHGVCHVPGPGEPDNIWWFGFDTGHCFDHSPAMAARLAPYRERQPFIDRRETYRDLAYVRAEVARLAAQLAAVRA